VRVNPVTSHYWQDDLAAVVRPGLAGLVAPKVDRPQDVRILGRLLDALEPTAGLPPGSVRIIVAIESGLGLMNAYQSATASPRVVGLMFGAEDYSLDLGLPVVRVGEAAELIYARSAMVNACAAARTLCFDGVWPDITDPGGLEEDAQRARRLGFDGKCLIHPSQTETVNRTFSPGPAEVEYALRVMHAFAEAEARGDGAVALRGQLIDQPIIARARRILEMAEA
jgi:citrate lyase subunit beta/citryl-CoA lyase